MGFIEIRPGVYEPDEEYKKLIKENKARQAKREAKKKSRKRYSRSYSPKHRGGGRSFFIEEDFLRIEKETDEVEELAKKLEA